MPNTLGCYVRMTIVFAIILIIVFFLFGPFGALKAFMPRSRPAAGQGCAGDILAPRIFRVVSGRRRTSDSVDPSPSQMEMPSES